MRFLCTDWFKKLAFSLTLFLTIAVVGYSQSGTIYYVKPTGTGTGSSWADATTLAEALKAATSGAKMYVTAGLHVLAYDATGGSPSDNRAKTFAIKAGVEIYGGFSDTSPEASPALRAALIPGTPSSTTLTGALNPEDPEPEHSFHVVTFVAGSATAVLDRVVVTGGNADDIESEEDYHGAGIFIITDNGANSPILNDVTITENFASDGAGLYVRADAESLQPVQSSPTAFSPIIWLLMMAMAMELEPDWPTATAVYPA